MPNQVTVGEPAILLVGTATSPEQVVGTVADVNGDFLTLTFVARPAFGSMARGAIVVGPDGARHTSVAVFAQEEVGGFVFRLLGGWRPFVVRVADRYASDVPAKVRAAGLRFPLRGRLVDISQDGGAVRLDEAVPGRFLELALGTDGFEAWIPCDVVEQRREGESQLLHVSFGDLGVDGRMLIREVVGTLTARAESTSEPAEAAAPTEMATKASRPRKGKRQRGTWGAGARRKQASQAGDTPTGHGLTSDPRAG